MRRIQALLAAIVRRWWTLMSCAIFTALAFVVARYDKPNVWLVHWMTVLAVASFMLAPILAWWEENGKVLALQKQIADDSPRFVFSVGTMIWKFDNQQNLTCFFPLVHILNQGAPSIVMGWDATYQIGTSQEKMQFLYLRTPYRIVIGDEELTISNTDLLNVKTAETQIPRGGTAGGRLLVTLPGDRTAQVAALQFRIDVVCHDFKGNSYHALYTPSSEYLPKLLTLSHETAARIIRPLEANSEPPMLGSSIPNT